VLTSDGSAGGWTLGALYNLVNHRSLAASVSVDAELSSGDEDVVVEPALIAATQVGTAQVHGTVSVSLASEPEYFGGLGVMLDAGFLTPTAEITASGQEHAPTTIGVTPGLYLHLGHHAEIGVAAPIRVHGDELPGLRALATIEF
ncbi:MAG TPA: hypothetical protein VGX50_21290, partial [Longimicrobium sp.]|nr:hypothetical protein [Longimicrobium sp.]